MWPGERGLSVGFGPNLRRRRARGGWELRPQARSAMVGRADGRSLASARNDASTTEGGSPVQSMASSLDLAHRTETPGDRRYRVVEHHRAYLRTAHRDARAPGLLQRQSSAVHPRPVSTALCSAYGRRPWERGRLARKRAAGPPHGQAGDAYAPGLLQRQSSAVHPRPVSTALCSAYGGRPWERGRLARKRAAGPPHGQAGDAHALGLLQRQSSAVHPRPVSTALCSAYGGRPWERGRLARKRAAGPPHGQAGDAYAPGLLQRQSSAVHPRPVSTALCSAYGRRPWERGRLARKRAAGPPHEQTGDAYAPGLLQRQSSAVHPRPASTALCSAYGRRPWERGRLARKRAAGPPHGQAGDAHALGLLQRQSSAVHPRPVSTALCSGYGRRPWERGRLARKRAAGPPHGQAGDAHAPGLLQRQSSAVHPRPVSTALCSAYGRRPWERGRLARKRAAGPPHGQAGDAHAPGLLQRQSSAVHPRLVSTALCSAYGRRPWERGRLARKRAAGPPHEQTGDAYALGLLQRQSSAVHPRLVSTALCSAYGRRPWERGRLARKRAAGPPHGQAGDAHASGLLQRQSSAVHPRPVSTALCSAYGRRPWERGRLARKRAAGPPHEQTGDAYALGLSSASPRQCTQGRSRRHCALHTGAVPGSAGVSPASGPQARHMGKRATPTLSGCPAPVLGSAPKAGLDGIVLCIRAPSLGARASRPQAGRRPATWASGRRLRSRAVQRQSSAVHQGRSRRHCAPRTGE